jgi:hypothetical protein
MGIDAENNTTPTNSVYGAMQDGYVERFDQKISPRPSLPKRGITISPFGKGGIRGILRIVGVVITPRNELFIILLL